MSTTSLRAGAAAGKKRVAAYARVSVDNEDTRKSLYLQITYFANLIRSRPEWVFAGIYADEGISGGHDRGRDAFMRMMSDAEAGKLDLILVKSVSRFARNTVDLLSAVRRLKALGVEVWFEEQNIRTLDAEGELLLTLMASVAQEESRSLSENIRWRFDQKKAKGEALSGQFPYGYRCRGSVVSVVPEEAGFVRHMFRRFLEGADAGTIARELNTLGSRTRRGREWDSRAVRNLLGNEKVTGAILLQKYYSPDALSGSRVNRGEVEQVYVENDHEAIISREDFAAAQERLLRCRDRGPGTAGASRYTGRIRCGDCGELYRHSGARVEGSGRWRCKNARTDGSGCRPFLLHDWELRAQTEKVLGPDFPEEALPDTVEHILVRPGSPAQLEYRLRNGERRTVEYTPRRRALREILPPEEYARRMALRGAKISAGRKRGRPGGGIPEGPAGEKS